MDIIHAYLPHFLTLKLLSSSKYIHFIAFVTTSAPFVVTVAQRHLSSSPSSVSWIKPVPSA